MSTHPGAIQDKINELREEWDRLDKIADFPSTERQHEITKQIGELQSQLQLLTKEL